MAKEKFIIEPHFRLHEWVAEEKGYFKDEGLDYEFRELVQSTDGALAAAGDKVGAMQTFERGRKSDVSCACHWTVNVAASKGHGKLYGDVYSVSPAASSCRRIRRCKTPEDLAGVPISVGYQSGSHYATIQALEQYMPHDKINLSFKDGMLFGRMEKLLDGEVAGLHAVLRAVLLRRAARLPQDDRLHLHDGDHDHRRSGPGGRAASSSARCGARSATSTCGRSSTRSYYKKEFPKRFHGTMDTRRWGPGERIVFEPYSTRDLRGLARLDRRARHLRRQRSRRQGLRQRGGQADGLTGLRFAPREDRCSGRAWRDPSAGPPSGRGARSRRAPAARALLGERQRDLGVLLDQDHGGAFLGDHAARSPRSAPRR